LFVPSSFLPQRSGLDIVKSTDTFDFSCAKPGRLPPDALLHLERLVTGLSAFADQRLPALRTRMQLHFVTTDKGGPVRNPSSPLLSAV
jgi:hypothetical protein